MKKDNFKTDTQIANEKQEALDLIAKIISMTNTVPAKVNAGSYQMAVNYKNDAIAARRTAEGKLQNLGKLRSAWQSIQSYYS